jgi:hypothetical protein
MHTCFPGADAERYVHLTSERVLYSQCTNRGSLAYIYMCMPMMSAYDGVRTGAIFFTESYGRTNTALVNTSLTVTRCLFTENYADE